MKFIPYMPDKDGILLVPNSGLTRNHTAREHCEGCRENGQESKPSCALDCIHCIFYSEDDTWFRQWQGEYHDEEFLSNVRRCSGDKRKLYGETRDLTDSILGEQVRAIEIERADGGNEQQKEGDK